MNIKIIRIGKSYIRSNRSIASLFDIAGHSARVGVVGHSIGRKVPVEIGKTIWKTLHIAGSGGTDRWFPRTIRFMSQLKTNMILQH